MTKYNKQYKVGVLKAFKRNNTGIEIKTSK